MKLKAISILILSIITLAFIKSELPKHQVTNNLQNNLSEFRNSIELYEASLDGSRKELITHYKVLRCAYKRIESFVVFRYPQIDKAINGGPVPSITTEIVILHKDDPHGLQVMEELLVAEHLDRDALDHELQLLKKSCNLLENSFKNYPLQHWEILEANHLALTRLMTLGLTGFDSPAMMLAKEDAIIVIEQIQTDLASFNDNWLDTEIKKFVNEKCKMVLELLRSSVDYASIDLYTLFRDHMIPLQSAIREMHLKSGFETYNEVSTIPRTISNAPHLFHEDYLDPLASFRGQLSEADLKQVALGKMLFYDPLLSGNNKRACSSCHSPNNAFTDNLKTSKAFDGENRIDRNSPTLLNTAYQSNFFYDLRSEDMNDQIMHVFNNSDELNITQEQIIEKLLKSPGYIRLFKEAFSTFEQPVNIATVKSSLELYVRSLIATNSRFDKNIRGKENTFTTEEKLGANLFFGKAACATCHFPPHFNGFVPPHYTETEGEILGVPDENDSSTLDDDEGVYNRFKYAYRDAMYVKGMFKTPTLRNVELTAPYMHNGIYTTLEEVVRFYNDGGGAGRGLDIPQQTLAADTLGLTAVEQAALVAFMKTLTDSSANEVEPFELPKVEGVVDRVWGGEY